MKAMFWGVLLISAGTATAAPTSTIDADHFSGMQARSIGPAAMSGRVTAIEASSKNPNIVYVGGASSGVWRSDNAGVTFKPIFGDQPVHSIGAMALSPDNPDLLWVGTGEGNVRNSVSIGRGVFKTTDGGKTWQDLGLHSSERINRIVLHPNNPDVAWVAALGPLWSAGGERGIYKTTDGGKTWAHVLKTADRVGASELIIDPSNPLRLYASTWRFERTAHSFSSGGDGSALWRSVDGGETWTQLNQVAGMPEDKLGRIALAIAPSEPNRIYALVESTKNVLLRSDDFGDSFAVANSSVNVHPRPFYFSELRVDPTRPDRLYRLAVVTEVSDDAGKSFSTLIGWDDLHPDHHALWVHPTDGKTLINGNDGGIGFSTDRGATWRYTTNLPFAQFYHINVDRSVPYNVYGGLQDNGSWRGPSAVWEYGGIHNHHWIETNFGDGFDSSIDPADPNRGYAMSQQGYLVRFNLQTGERRFVRPAPPDAKTDLRFHWNAGLAQDPFDAGTIYFGSQFLHRSTDRGASWQTISADLTSNDPALDQWKTSGGLTPDSTGAEVRMSIIAVEPSAVDKGLIWVGTDDGRVQVTRDGGDSWSRIDGGARGAPKLAYVPHIYASRHDAGRAFVVFDNHREGDMAPHAYRVEQFGKSWTRLGLDGVDGYALKLIEDPAEPRLLYLGTELGLYVSLDGGGSFFRWTAGVPTVSVMDMAIQEDEHDLVLGTHGLGVLIIDDVRPLRAMASSGVPTTLTAWAGSGLLHTRSQGAGPRFPGNSEYIGENEAYGARISFWVNDASLPYADAKRELERKRMLARAGKAPSKPDDEAAKPKKVWIEIRDSAGELVRATQLDAKQGLNSWRWGLDSQPVKSASPPPPWAEPSGIDVVQGRYAVSLRYGAATASTTVEVGFDPRDSVPVAAQQQRRAALLEAAALQESVVSEIEALRVLRDDLTRLSARIDMLISERNRQSPGTEFGPDDALNAAKKAQGKSLEALDKLDLKLWVDGQKVKGYTPDEDALSKLGVAEWALSSTFDAPSSTAQGYMALAKTAVDEALAAVRSGREAERAAAAERAASLKISLFAP